MRLSKIQITNFRCFESLEIRFSSDENVHVIVGDNGAGKSAILDAVALGLAPIARRFGQSPGGRLRGLLDIMAESHEAQKFGDLSEAEPQKPFYHISFDGWTGGQLIGWDVHLLRDKSRRTKNCLPQLLGLKALHEALDPDVSQVAARTGGVLPVFAYYGTSRAVIDIPRRKRGFQTGFSRESAIKNALDPVSRFKDAFEWFFAMERDELKLRDEKRDFDFKLPVLEAVRRAIQAMLPEFTNPRITTLPLHFQLSHKNPDGTVTDLIAEQLSDGYRTMLALVMDFARRLAQANPQLKDPLESEAILLIDEVDLHLHPIWQQRIVPNLAHTFPNTQIILTTHSQEVVTTVKSRSVIILRNGKAHPCEVPTYGARSSEVGLEVLDVKNLRPPNNDITTAVSKLFLAIDAGDLGEARIQRAILSEWARGYPESDLVRADLLIRRLEVSQAAVPKKTE